MSIEQRFDPHALFWGRCPDCNSSLAVRSGEYGRFIGCTAYPRCEYTENLDRTAENILDGTAEPVHRGDVS